MKKKKIISSEDLNIWKKFIENPRDIYDKENISGSLKNKRFIFDLHGLSLTEANDKVSSIIDYCVENNYNEILFITGKGNHSKSNKDVFVSNNLSKLRYSVPEFISKNNELSKKIKSVSAAKKNEGGDGALVIKLKKL